MICPVCERGNDPKRRYCGKCGHNFQPCCRRCSFVNEGSDRFCGGCGANLIASEGVHLKRAAPEGFASAVLPPPPPAPRLATAPPEGPRRKPPTPPPPPRRTPPTPPPPPAALAPPPADELAGLFVATVLPSAGKALPQTGVSQDDVDRLFGGTP